MNVACLVYDDRPRARDLISRMFAAVPDVHRVVAVASVDELVHRLGGEPGQVAVVGTRRAEPGDCDAVRRILTTRPGASVMVIGARDDTAVVREAVAAGACSFVRWDASSDVLSALLNAVAGARSAGPPRGARVRTNAPGSQNGAGAYALAAGAFSAPGSLSDVVTHAGVQMRLRISRREMQVLGGISEGMSNAEIGRELYLSDNTVKSLARRLFWKLEVHERAHAVARAYRLGLFASCDEV